MTLAHKNLLIGVLLGVGLVWASKKFSLPTNTILAKIGI